MYQIIEKELAKNHQAYFIFPRISDEEDEGGAVGGYKVVSQRFDNYRVALLTGKSKDKTEILQAFRAGDIDILVSTVISECGIDCPNANVAVIEGADKFGLSTLHQIRGRVCRSEDTAFCFLMATTSNPTSIARLEVVERINDGFEIAEHDLRLRGPGEVFSTRQSGLPDLTWCSLVDDYDLMIEAKEMVASGDVGDGVKEMMRIRYGDNLYLGEVT
jgi:ATP-dependent DNA helicase RecG